MDFELTDRQKAVQTQAREFADLEFSKEIALSLDETGSFPFEIWKKAARSGLIGLHFPAEYGGQGNGVTENILTVEAFCRKDSGIGVAISLVDFSSEVILHFGNPEQKKKYLFPVAKGESISAGAYTEPDHGSDITTLFTTGTRQGDSYLINGTKTFITNGTMADFFIVLCQTDPDARPPYRGQCTLLVEKGSPGFSATEIKPKMGIRMTSTAQLTFNNVRVPCSHLIGQENRGFYQVLEFFDESRIEIAAQALGISEGAFERGLEFVKSRKQFGARLIDFQATRHRLADMAIQIEAARLLTYQAAWNYDRKRIDPKLTSMAKMHAAKTAVDVTGEVVELLGGYGYLNEYEVERFYRDAKITEIYEGTREIQKNTIASSLAGKP